MNIPSRVNPFGYDNSIPPGYLSADFLESTYKQYVDTGYVNVPSTEAECVYSKTIANNKPLFGTEKTTGDFCVWINSNSRLWWKIGGSSQMVDYQTTPGVVYNFRLNSSGLYVNSELIAHTGVSSTGDTSCLLWSVGGSNSVYRGYGRCYSFKLKDSQGIQRNLIPTIDSTGIPCMYDLVTKQSFRNKGTGQFTVGLTTKQAVNLAHLPVPTTINTMTISLPLEAAFDANVESALEAAADKGWTITVQYRESELTTKNIPADFLESTGTQYIRTQVSLSSEAKVEVETEDFENRPESGAFGTEHTNDSYSPLNTTNRFNFFRFRGPARSDYGSDAKTLSKWWPSFKRVHVVKDKNKSYVDGVLYYEHEKTTFDGIPAFLFSLGNSPAYYYTGRIFWIKMGNNGVVEFSGLPTLDSTGTPCMYDTVSGQNFYNVGTGAFTVGFDTTEKAAISLSKLPLTTDGTLTVSLPAAAQNTDTLVPAAIDIATNRGWTIITQYRED